MLSYRVQLYASKVQTPSLPPVPTPPHPRHIDTDTPRPIPHATSIKHPNAPHVTHTGTRESHAELSISGDSHGFGEVGEAGGGGGWGWGSDPAVEASPPRDASSIHPPSPIALFYRGPRTLAGAG